MTKENEIQENQNDNDSINIEELFNQDFNPSILNRIGEKDELESTSIYTTSKVYTTSKGHEAVPQVVHYSFRGEQLLEYSLHSYAAIIDVIQKPAKIKKSTSTRGRPTNGMFQFAKGHPLFETHIQRLRSKPKVPVTRNVPRPPPKKQKTLTNAWKKQARLFSEYFLTLFKPWKFPTSNGGTLPGPLTWNALCLYIHNLEEGDDKLGPSFFNQVNIRWIRSMADGLRTSARDRAAVSECRSRGVKTWKELENEENNEFTKSSENNNQEIEEEQNLSLIAELNIELLIAETANDDIFSNENEQEKKFLEATKSTLENLITMTENININNIQGLGFNHDIIIYKYNDMEEKIKNVIEKIKPDYQEQLEENFNQYLNDEDSFIGPQRNPTIPTSDPTLLNTSQQQILNTAKEYFQAKKMQPMDYAKHHHHLKCWYTEDQVILLKIERNFSLILNIQFKKFHLIILYRDRKIIYNKLY